MEDEIDIEEHDVLEHPRIRDMLLGLVSVKTEVEDYDEETGMDIEEDYQPFISTAYEDAVNGNTFNNPEMMGLEASTSGATTHGALALDLDYEEGIEDLDSQGHHDASPQRIRNKIECYQRTYKQKDGGDTSILKSLLSEPVIRDETDTQEDLEEEFSLPECAVLLVDCKSILQNNPCFCKECEILFPTDNDFEAHKMISHSFLVAVTNNKAVKSTSKSFNSSSESCNLLCNHCNVVFPNTIALLSHTYNLLPGEFECDKCDMVFENDAACKQHKASHSRDPSKSVTAPTLTGLYFICRVCSCHFKFCGRYRAHMEKSHRIEETEVAQQVYSNLQCKLLFACAQKSDSPKQFHNSREYNKHIVKLHSSLYHKRFTDSENSKFKCPKCNMCFSSDYSVRIHLAAKHGYVGNVKDSKKLASFGNKSSKTVKPKKFNNISQVPSSGNINTWPLPKSTLFKCNKCQIHFVSCIAAVVHSNQCRTKKEFFQCTQCKRSIKLQDRFYHNYQHSVSNKFKVLVVSRNILSRILCKCITCNICFDEKSFITHHTNVCNGETPSIHCKECKIWIHTKAMAVHKKIHTSVASKEFVIVDYVHADTSVQELHNNGGEEDEDSQDLEEKTVIDSKNCEAKTKSVHIIKRKDKYAYFFCPTCKCNMKVKRGTHHIGKCDPRVKTFTCKLCGLRFTGKGLHIHRMLHKKFPKLKLKDLKFVNIQTDKIINAPFPNFKKCKRCKVTFYSSLALRSHTCHGEEAKACKYCDEKFSDVAYKLHVPYHEYPKTSKANVIKADNKISEMTKKDSELIKKYESLKQVWNILFLCQVCDIVMDNYDQVVVHCQDHFCNMQSYNVTIEHCDICDLNFVDNCYEKHKELHVNNHINKESFKLIEYTYENLLLDSWTDIFRTLTKEQIYLILSKSIYSFTRCVRMKVVTKGPTTLTLYQCGICEVIVPADKVNEHAQNINICEGIRKFGCSYCTLTFAYKRHREVHESLHQVKKLNAASFKIVQFYDEKQFSATIVRKNDKKDKTNSHSLKFIRCQRCGKLINKHKYKMHTQNHGYYDTYKAKLNVVKSKNSNPKQRVNRKVGFKFLVCKTCNLCVSRRNIKKHACNANYATTKCSQCSLLFRDTYIASHYGYHAKHSFNSSQINIVYFENGIILKKDDNVKGTIKTDQFIEERRTGNKNIKKKSRLPNLRVILQSKVMPVYKCANCETCLWHRNNLRRHFCASEKYRVKCDICGLTLNTSKMPEHIRLHKVRQFDASNLKYIKFKPGVPLPRKIRSTNTALVGKRKPLAPSEEAAVKRRRLNKNINENADEGSDHDNIAKNLSTSKDTDVEEEGKDYETAVKNSRVGNSTKINRTFENSRVFTDFICNRYYKCKNCKLLFVTCTGLVEHEDVCGKKREAVENSEAIKNNEAIKCSDCGLVFHASMIEQHKVQQKCKQHIAERIVLLTIKQKGKSHNNHKNWLYICATCNVYNLSFYGITYHFQNKHQNKYALKTCTICNITLSSTTFNRHANLFHRGKICISDLYIASVEDTNLKDALKDLPVDNDVIYVDQGLYVQNLMTNKDFNSKAPINNLTFDKEYTPETYTCDVCQLNFVHENALLSHYKRGIHKQERSSCDLCGLNFTNRSMNKHMQLHHSDQKIIKEKKDVVNSTAVEIVSSSFDNNNQHDASSIEDYPTAGESKNYEDTVASSKLKEKSETENVTSENIDSENYEDKIEISDLHRESASACVIKSNSNIDTVNKTKNNNTGISEFVTESKDIDTGNSIVNSARSNEIKPNTVSNTTNIELNKNKLYKCSHCNVYYLTADDCREHTNNHTQLDPTEYIACKICDLQFCCEYLGRHMRSHREKTFCIDDLIVAEYHFEHGDVKIDTYLAVDRLKTKLVTTTTNFDTVDSTTAEGS